MSLSCTARAMETIDCGTAAGAWGAATAGTNPASMVTATAPVAILTAPDVFLPC
ncbi:hypothetical protein GCM10011374_07770 [Kocuria dechangensis]|uniref:Uncharacterized protein n=1 Tax=Kocuria dechangensis TaxID=1176249 RepID=A0A917LNT0_9MICC|nr:hypothetical protein GCM10011374_07770 [Kocuria dechangensis]